MLFKLGYKDSNLEMTESESVALPFGDTPMKSTINIIGQIPEFVNRKIKNIFNGEKKSMKVFLCEHIHKKAYDLLAQQAEIISDYARMAEADAIINRNLKIDRGWMLGCPNLKVIGIHGTGTDGVDLKAAAELGIKVIYVPYENADSVAELIVAFALVMARKLPWIDRMITGGEMLPTGAGSLQGMELSGKVFGMVGCGDIALRAAKRLRDGMGMKVIGYSPSLTEEKAAALGIGCCASVEEVFARSDVINVGVRLTPETRNLITGEILSHAKHGSILINTARGGVIDEQALYQALTDGTLTAAACDVFVSEPPTKENPLVGLPNFLATPHIGANTEEALYRVGYSTVTQVLKVLAGETEGIRWAK